MEAQTPQSQREPQMSKGPGRARPPPEPQVEGDAGEIEPDRDGGGGREKGWLYGRPSSPGDFRDRLPAESPRTHPLSGNFESLKTDTVFYEAVVKTVTVGSVLSEKSKLENL